MVDASVVQNSALMDNGVSLLIGAAVITFISKIIWDWLKAARTPAPKNPMKSPECRDCGCLSKIEACERANILVDERIKHVDQELVYNKESMSQLAQSVQSIEQNLSRLLGMLEGIEGIKGIKGIKVVGT